MLHVEITDENCAEDEAHVFSFPVGTDLAEIMKAIGFFYPTATQIIIQIKEE